MKPDPALRGYGPKWRVLRAFVLARDRYICGWCGAEAVTVDHIVGKAEGGTDHPSNLTAACAKCQYQRANEQSRGSRGWL